MWELWDMQNLQHSKVVHSHINDPLLFWVWVAILNSSNFLLMFWSISAIHQANEILKLHWAKKVCDCFDVNFGVIWCFSTQDLTLKLHKRSMFGTLYPKLKCMLSKLAFSIGSIGHSIMADWKWLICDKSNLWAVLFL